MNRNARQTCRRLFLESLEVRAVLSATCELVDGLLSIQCSSGEDDISVHFDHESGWVQVLGNDKQLLGQFSASDVLAIQVNDLLGNDRFVIDSELPIAATISSSQDASTHSHSHFPISTSPSLETTGSAVNNESSIDALLLGAMSLAAHASHAVGQVDFLLAAPGEHNLSMPHFADSVLSGSALPSHGHAGSHAASATAEGEATAIASDTPLLALSRTSARASKHDDHIATEVKSQITKWCTITFTGKNAILADEGDRKCDCDKKKAAAKAAHDAEARTQQQSLVDSVLGAQVECLPCQRQSLEWGLAGGGTCSLVPGVDRPNVFDWSTIPAQTCSASTANEDAVVEGAQSPLLDAAQLAGWSLVAASAALAPTLLEKKRRQHAASIDQALEAEFNWLAGHLRIELLTR